MPSGLLRLQVEQQRTAGRPSRPAGHPAGAVTYGRSSRPTVNGAESSRRRRRRVAQESGNAVENVTSFEETAKDLGVVGVHHSAGRS